MLTTTRIPLRKSAARSVTARARPRRDFAAMEARRMIAADRFAKSISQADIARELSVSHQTISDWHEKWLTGGKRALRSVGRAGRPPKVSTSELTKVERALRRGPKANGFSTELWTLARVAKVIEETTGVGYHPGHVWRVLRQMGWSRQRPARQATERDDRAIEAWVNERWPRVKKRPGQGTPGLSTKTRSGFSLLPSVRATWAPRGETPVLHHHLNNWKRLSMSAAVCFRPDASDAALVFGMRPGSYNDEALMEFLIALHHHLASHKVTLIWDGLPSHRSRAMKQFIKEQRRWLVVEPLTPYAYDLNPVEQVWGNLKGTEFANLCPDTIGEAADIADEGLCRIGSEPRLCFAFLRHCGLQL